MASFEDFAVLMEEMAEEALSAIDQPPVIVPVLGDGPPVKFGGAHFGGRAWAFQDAAQRARSLHAMEGNADG